MISNKYSLLFCVICLTVSNGCTSIQNPDFESGDLSGWTTSSQNSAIVFSITDIDSSSGNYSLKVSTSDDDKAELTQAVTGLQNGIYSLSAYIKNSGGQDYCFLSVSGFGGTEKRSSLPVSSNWKQIMIRGIEVTNNSLDLAFRTDALAGQWFQVDNLQLVKDGIPYTMLIGGDISELSKVEDAGGRYYENGVEKDCLEILKNNGWNLVRLRLYNDPGNPAYSKSNRLPAGYLDPTDILSLARRAKDKGMQIQLSFHYSDYWTNPGLQDKPHEWEGLNFTQLKTALYNFTHSFMQQMVDQGTIPEFVSLGNETPGGILWPDGKTYSPNNWPQLAQLLNEGYNAVKAASPTSQVILHLDDACDYDKYNDFFGQCNSYGVQYDIIGTSYYPFWTQSTVVQLAAFINTISQTYNKPVMIMEVGYNWNPTRSDGYIGQLQNNGPMPYPSTPQGQKDFMLEFISAIPTMQNGKCIGAIYWDPVMITVPGIGWELGAPNVVDNTTLFDFKGNALPVLDAFRDNGIYLPPAPGPAQPAVVTFLPRPYPTIFNYWDQGSIDKTGICDLQNIQAVQISFGSRLLKGNINMPHAIEVESLILHQSE